MKVDFPIVPEREIPRSGRLLIADEVQRIFAVSRTTLWRWIKAGKIPKPCVAEPTCRRWRAEDVWAAYDRLGKE